MMNKIAIFIPARMNASRLPNKSMALIGNLPLIENIWEKALLMKESDIFVACFATIVANHIQSLGGQAVLTDSCIPCGTDGIYAVYEKIKESYDSIINLLGDLPFINPLHFYPLMDILQQCPQLGLSTLASPLDPSQSPTHHRLKTVLRSLGKNNFQVLYFSRSPVPYGGPFFYHLGIYAYRLESLKKFTHLPPSPLERSENLEQLQMLKNNIPLGGRLIDAIP